MSKTAHPFLASRRPPLRIGFVPLVDAAPLLVADALGLFARHGLRVQLQREVGWATIREKLIYRELDAAHAPAGLAFTLRLGLHGPAPCDILAAFVFNLHGNAITLSLDLWNRGAHDAHSLAKLIRGGSGRPLVLGVVSPHSSHNFLIRRWLQSANINPDHDVRITVIPPTQMLPCLQTGLLDGYCVGEPWNSAAILSRSGFSPATSRDIAPSHPEKVLLVRREIAESHPDDYEALLLALHEACAYCDRAENRPHLVEILLATGHFRTTAPTLLNSLVGPFDRGDNTSSPAADFHIFHRNNTNAPSHDKARWVLKELSDHGLLSLHEHSRALDLIPSIWRHDLYLQTLASAPLRREDARQRSHEDLAPLPA